jgi:spore cortex biosynthesis protein YabQ
MSWRIHAEWLLMMGWCGWQLTALIDTMRVMLRSASVPHGVRKFFDLLFAAAAGYYLFRQIMILNGGEWRLVFLLAACGGAWFYWRWFRGIFHWMTESIVRIIRHILQYCKRLLELVVIKPVFWVLRLIWNRVFFPNIRRIVDLLKSSLTKVQKRIKLFVRRLTKFD